MHVVNLFTGGYLTNFGIEPREIGGAYTIATAPLIHADVAHLGSNLVTFVVLASLVLLQGVRYFVKASALIILLGGALVWLLARDGEHIGASGWIFGLWSLVIALAWFDRSPRNIAIALAVLFFYGGWCSACCPRKAISRLSRTFSARSQASLPPSRFPKNRCKSSRQSGQGN